jgi:hypothetical protein
MNMGGMEVSDGGSTVFALSDDSSSSSSDSSSDDQRKKRKKKKKKKMEMVDYRGEFSIAFSLLFCCITCFSLLYYLF